MEKKWIVTGLILLITGIILGAFGAHVLKDIISDPVKLASFETGVRYQLINAVAFLVIPTISNKYALSLKAVYALLLGGILMFSVSIYLLTMKDVWGMEWLKFFGPVTPLGGTLLIVGWSILLIKVIRVKRI